MRAHHAVALSLLSAVAAIVGASCVADVPEDVGAASEPISDSYCRAACWTAEDVVGCADMSNFCKHGGMVTFSAAGWRLHCAAAVRAACWGGDEGQQQCRDLCMWGKDTGGGMQEPQPGGPSQYQGDPGDPYNNF